MCYQNGEVAVVTEFCLYGQHMNNEVMIENRLFAHATAPYSPRHSTLQLDQNICPSWRRRLAHHFEQENGRFRLSGGLQEFILFIVQFGRMNKHAKAFMFPCAARNEEQMVARLITEGIDPSNESRLTRRVRVSAAAGTCV